MRKELLIEQINSLLALDRDGALRPHGLGGLARDLFERSVTALTNPVDDWTVDDTETAGEILTMLGIGCDASKEPGADWRRDKIAKIIRARIVSSSPGKDGGQEVEAAEWQGRYWIEDENRWSNWITNPVGYPWAYDLQEGKSEIRYLYPQPASTALVERLDRSET